MCPLPFRDKLGDSLPPHKFISGKSFYRLDCYVFPGAVYTPPTLNVREHQSKDSACTFSLLCASSARPGKKHCRLLFFRQQVLKRSFGFLREMAPEKGRENKQEWTEGEASQQSLPTAPAQRSRWAALEQTLRV